LAENLQTVTQKPVEITRALFYAAIHGMPFLNRNVESTVSKWQMEVISELKVIQRNNMATVH